MTDTQHLLTDVQMQQFIRDGYIQVKADFAAPLHQHIYDGVEEVYEKEGNIGNNLLPRLPQIKEVFDHPKVAGALESLLGPRYIMNPHRHGHLNPPGSKGQSWHKDCYVFDHNTRHPCHHWILALYYPQDTTEDMGPTGILPGLQNWEHISNPDPTQCSDQDLALCCEAGTVTLLHFDAWHRAMANSSERKRYMLKFQFARMQWPPTPSWNHQRAAWQLDSPADPVEHYVWNWLCRQASAAKPQADAQILLAQLQEGGEAERLRAAYALGQHDTSIVPALLDVLRREARAAEPHIEDKTADNAHGTNPTALRAAQALEAMGPRITPLIVDALDDAFWLVRAALCDILGLWGPAAAQAVPALTARLADEHWWVRRNAAEALGRMGGDASTALPDLIKTLGDEDRRVRRASALAWAQIGAYSPEALPALRKMSADTDRYNRFYAQLALSRMDHEAAREALLDALFTARWCPLTTSEDRY